MLNSTQNVPGSTDWTSHHAKTNLPSPSGEGLGMGLKVVKSGETTS